MNDHPLRRAEDSLEVMLGRVDERTRVMLDHLELLSGRLGRAELRLDVLESTQDRRLGAAQERSRWFGALAFAGQKVIPAGGGLAGIVALAHYWSGQVR